MSGYNLSRIFDDAIFGSDLPATFLANRLYELMGYDTPTIAATFINAIKKTGKPPRSIDSIICPGDPLRSRKTTQENLQNIALVLYAMGIPEDSNVVGALKEDGVTYPPENGIPYEEIKRIQNALRNPSSADTETLLGLEMDEKLRVLSRAGLGGVEQRIDDLISEGMIKERYRIR